jgi:gamma-glutamylputrescine oxidase
MVSFEQFSNSIIVRTSTGSKIIAKRIVFATGGYAGKEQGFLRSRWLPIGTFIGVTSPFPDFVKEEISENLAVSDNRRAGNYFRLLPDKRLLWGRDISALNHFDTKKSEALVKKDINFFFSNLINRIGGINNLKIDYSWYGRMSYSFHKMPYVGLVSTNIFALTAFGGHGMNSAPAAAIVLAEYLAGTSNRSCIFNKIPRCWNGSFFGPIGAELIYKTMKIRDRFSFM